MAESLDVELCESEKEACKTFLQRFTTSSLGAESENELRNDRFEPLCFCLTKSEINGEVIDVLHRFLYHKECPAVLVAPLICFVKKKFLGKEFGQFQLERCNNDENEITEYNASSLVKELYKTFQSACKEFLQNFDVQRLRKNPQPCHISVHAVRNRRRKMEDRHVYYPDLNCLFEFDKIPCGQALFCVFDGHGGTDAANYAASQLVCNLKANPNLLTNPGTALSETIIKTDVDFCAKSKRERLRSGATAVLALVQGMNLTIAWLGDSQVVLCKAGQTVQLVDPHRPDRTDERERIEALGGCVVHFGGWRVNGSLAVSRAIGDCEQKPFISGVPDVDEYEMEGDEEFLILACDGLWDNVALDDAVQLVCQCVRDGERDSAAYKLVELAKDSKAMDNISVLVVYFDFNGPPVSAAVAANCREEEKNGDQQQQVMSKVEGQDMAVNGDVKQKVADAANDGDVKQKVADVANGVDNVANGVADVPVAENFGSTALDVVNSTDVAEATNVVVNVANGIVDVADVIEEQKQIPLEERMEIDVDDKEEITGSQ